MDGAARSQAPGGSTTSSTAGSTARSTGRSRQGWRQGRRPGPRTGCPAGPAGEPGRPPAAPHARRPAPPAARSGPAAGRGRGGRGARRPPRWRSALAAGASAAGSWVGVVGVPSLGLAAAAELGVALERLVLVAPPAPGEWATVAATLVDAFDVVLAAPPRRGGLAMGRRLQARVRERGRCCARCGLGRHRARPHPGHHRRRRGRASNQVPGACRPARSRCRPRGGGPRPGPARPPCGCPMPRARSAWRSRRPSTRPGRAVAPGRWSPGRSTRWGDGPTSPGGGLRAGWSRERVASGGSVPRLAVVWCPEWPVVAAGAKPGEPAAVLHANRVRGRLAGGPGRGGARRAAPPRGAGRLPRPGRARPRSCPRRPGLRARCSQPSSTSPPGWRSPARAACVFGTRGPSRYHGGDDALAARWPRWWPRCWGRPRWRWPAPLAWGWPTGAFTAELAARPAPPLEGAPSWCPGGQRAFLAPLPIATLELVESWGPSRRAGLLRPVAPPRPAHARRAGRPPRPRRLDRFGPLGRLAHRLASGGDERPPSTRRPPPELAVQAELEPAGRPTWSRWRSWPSSWPTGSTRSLAADGLVCTRVVVVVETEHGERQERRLAPRAGLHRAGHRRAGPLAAGGVGRRPGTRPTGGISLAAPGARRGGARPGPPARASGEAAPWPTSGRCVPWPA